MGESTPERPAGPADEPAEAEQPARFSPLRPEIIDWVMGDSHQDLRELTDRIRGQPTYLADATSVVARLRATLRNAATSAKETRYTPAAARAELLARELER